MVHHLVSCSQYSRYLHSDGWNCIDFAEGFRLFFLCSIKSVLLNHQRPVANDSPLPAGPMTCFVHRHTVCYDVTSEHFELQQLLYMKHNMPARHPLGLSCSECWINVALPTHFNSDKFVSCQSDLWALGVQFVLQRLDYYGGPEEGRVLTLYPIISLWLSIIVVKSSFSIVFFLHTVRLEVQKVGWFIWFF